MRISRTNPLEIIAIVSICFGYMILSSLSAVGKVLALAEVVGASGWADGIGEHAMSIIAQTTIAIAGSARPRTMSYRLTKAWRFSG